MILLLGDLTIHAREATRFDRGLLDEERLRPGEGMIFVFESDVNVPFHTYGMRFPIDILFLAQSGRIVSAAESVAAGKTITSPVSFRAVLELPAGTYARHPVPSLIVLSDVS